jgi:hypothetical protein
MDCAAVQPLLSPFLDGELDGPDHDGVTAHLDRCVACQRRLRELQDINDIWSAAAPPEPSEDAWQNVERKLARLEGAGQRHFRLRRWLAASILLLICGGGAWAMVQFGGERLWHSVELARSRINLVGYLDDEHSPTPGKAIKPEEICAQVEFPTLKAPEELPDGYKLQRCCVFGDGVVRYKYKCGDKEVILLLYRCGHTVVHGNKPLLSFELQGKTVRIAQCKKRVSASWQVNDTAVSLIASSDLIEFTRLLKYVDCQLAENH